MYFQPYDLIFKYKASKEIPAPDALSRLDLNMMMMKMNMKKEMIKRIR
jgi:hypothetical protein